MSETFDLNPFTGELERFNKSTDGGGTGPGTGYTCVDVVMNLTANVFASVTHGFTTKVCDFKAYDTAGNEIELVSRLSGLTLELCSTQDINNILVIVEGF